MIMPSFLRVVVAALGLVALTAPVQEVFAQSYPDKPVTVVVPFGPGGSTDLAARAMADAITPHLGQSVVVVNKPGASGAVAMKSLIAAPADGYTLLMATIGTNAILPAVSATLPFKYDDITAIGRTQVVPTVLVVRKDAPWKTVQELLKAAKEKPGTLRASTAGIGTLHDLGIQFLVKLSGAPPRSITTIPYKGSAEAETALVGGHVDMSFTNLIAVIGHIKNGTIRALAVVSPIPGKRVPDLPDVPTFEESGLGRMDIIGWKGVIGPPNLPAAVVAKWEAAIRKMTEDTGWRERIGKLGDVPAFQTGKEFGAYIKSEYQRYDAVAKELGIVRGK
jgi:tripartite-type tricarboxylate transporter receptor subunit TctC